MARLILAAAVGFSASAAQERVAIERSAGSGEYRVVSSVDGPLGLRGKIRGAGGEGHAQAARAAGADALRTWHVSNLTDALAGAEANGLRVSAGLWLPLEPERYENCSGNLSADATWSAELDVLLAAVRRHRNSSSLLWWTVGNEQELEVDFIRGNDCVWKRVEWAVQAVKAEDPGHPVGTVLAGVAEPKMGSIVELCPSLDFLGVNSYGDDALNVGSQLLEWNFTKPYALTEYGPTGHWASPLTEWDAYIEESSSQKVPRYNATCFSCYDDPMCVGAFAFVWGWKWEKTGTWYGMFNEWPAVTQGVSVDCPRCESEVLATLQRCWTGADRRVQPPTIMSMEVEGQVLPDMSFVVDQRDGVTVSVNVSHPNGSGLVAIWAATEEIVSSAVGGAFEATNPLLPGLWPSAAGNASTASGLTIELNTSGLEVGGQYRLYVFVRQDPASCGAACRDQEAVASLPFRICHTTLPGELCHTHVVFVMASGLHSLPQIYPGVNASSSVEEFQMMLFQKGDGVCPPPCGARAWCHTAVEGEECYGHVRWAMDHGIRTSPGAYPAKLRNASFEAFQKFVHDRFEGICARPCAEGSRPGDGVSHAPRTASPGVALVLVAATAALGARQSGAEA